MQVTSEMTRKRTQLSLFPLSLTLQSDKKGQLILFFVLPKQITIAPDSLKLETHTRMSSDLTFKAF